ncbi:MAG: ABC transporter ATP-binding protein [Paludibacteraceae bacterium]|nr:ABC transporter ATP-binding protein [Paludibacteraceae bacterium]
MKVFTINDLRKSFGTKKVLQQCNLELRPGEIVGILGPNGCGKTTLMKIILGFLESDNGYIEWSEQDFCPQKHAVGIIEAPAFYSELSAMDNLLYFIPDLSLERLNKYASAFGLLNDMHRKVGQFSYGMKQKLALIYIMLHNRDVLILDEPTNGLDIDSKRVFIELIKEITKSEDKYVLVSSHDMYEMDKLCDSVYFLMDGITSQKVVVDTLSEPDIYWVEFVDSQACEKFILTTSIIYEKVQSSDRHLKINNIKEPSSLIKELASYGIIEVKKERKTLADLYNDLRRTI